MDLCYYAKEKRNTLEYYLNRILCLKGIIIFFKIICLLTDWYILRYLYKRVIDPISRSVEARMFNWIMRLIGFGRSKVVSKDKKEKQLVDHRGPSPLEKRADSSSDCHRSNSYQSGTDRYHWFKEEVSASSFSITKIPNIYINSEKSHKYLNRSSSNDRFCVKLLTGFSQ